MISLQITLGAVLLAISLGFLSHLVPQKIQALDRLYAFRRNNHYPISWKYYEKYIKRLKSININESDQAISETDRHESLKEVRKENSTPSEQGLRIIINPLFENNDDDEESPLSALFKRHSGSGSKNRKKSKHFNMISDIPYTFDDVGGYKEVKDEIDQCIDLLQNYTKYARFNVRTPKGLILEGPPGNGKTLMAKALAGECKANFIPVSGAEFQEKYVGVGASRIRELFEFACNNKPCIIFIDEIDAVGRKRSNDGETSSNERDNTLNELLVALDGFKNTTGVFVIGATNRADLLDSALLRPGRMDKRVYIGNPDETTRRHITSIHIKGKPHDKSISIEHIVDSTNGFSGAQIENTLNEAMLRAIRNNRDEFNSDDINTVLNRILVGYQPSEHQFSDHIIEQIVIHELGHAVVGMLCNYHTKMRKIVINMQSPTSPGYTLFEPSTGGINTRDALFEHLMVLLAGRIAEESFYGISVTTGAISDFEEANSLAQKMILHYGMGKEVIYPTMSDAYREKIDNEVHDLIKHAYEYSDFIIRNSRNLISYVMPILKKSQHMSAEELLDIAREKFPEVLLLHPL